MGWKITMNDKYKLIALFGPAGSGKDYIKWHLIHSLWGKTHLHNIVPYTTRPPREGEIDGVSYNFIPTAAEFFKGDNLLKWVEFTSFKDWWYGTSFESLDKNKINIGIFNIDGIKQILQNENIECIPLYITCPSQTRLIRQLTREKNPNVDEIIRRYLTDQKDFLNIPFSYYVIENNTDEVQPIVKEIIFDYALLFDERAK